MFEIMLVMASAIGLKDSISPCRTTKELL